MRLILLLPFLFITACVSQTQHPVQPFPTPTPSASAEYPSGPPPQPNCPEVRAEFLVTQNELYTEKVRHLEVYLTPTAFSESNLRLLFACLSKDNPEPPHLTAEVETDWSRVHIPNGMPGTGASNMPPDPHEYDFLKAIYYRRPATDHRKRAEYFRYSPRIHLDQFYWTKVIIKK